MAAAIRPEKILKELAELWVSLGKQPSEEGATGVLRACTMTLVVLADQADDPAAIGETIAALMPEHPSRAILVRLSESPEPQLSARVFSQCWMPFGQRRQICCEQIEIAASDASLPALPSLVGPLAAADLPIVLWCRCGRRFRSGKFTPLAALADRVIVDTAAAPDPAAALAYLAEVARNGPPMADLAWTRLTRWRDLIAHIFENRTYAERLPRVERLRIAHAGATPATPALYLGAWLAAGLAQAGSGAAPRFTSEAGPGGGELRGAYLEGDGVDISVALAESGSVETRTGQLVHRAPLPRPTDYLLVREELSLAGRDTVFEKVLPAAVRLAVSSST